MLILFSVVPLVLLGVFLLWLSARTTTNVSRDISGQLIEQMAGRTRDGIRNYFERCVALSDTYERMILSEALPTRTPDDLRTWLDTLRAHLLSSPAIGSITFASPAGDAVYLMRVGEVIEFGVTNGSVDGDNCVIDYFDAAGQPLDIPQRGYRYDATQRPWYLSAQSSHAPIWTAVYKWFEKGAHADKKDFGTSYVKRVFGSDGREIGTLSIDVTLEQIQAILARLTSEGSSYAELRGTNQEVIGSNSSLSITDSEFVRAGLSNLKADQKSGSTSLISVSDTSGRKYYAQAIAVELMPGSSGVLMVVTPESQVLAKAISSRNYMIAVGLSYLAIVVLLTVWMARATGQPVKRLRDFAIAIGRGEFDRRVDALNGGLSVEYTQLALALNEMAEGLKQRVELIASKEAIEAHSRAKSEFFASMSHELRTPLNAMIGYSEMLEERARDEHRINDIEDQQGLSIATRRLQTLVTDLLDLSKIEAGKMTLAVERTDARLLIERVVAGCRPLIARSDNTLHLDISPDIGLIQTDAVKLEKIIENLLANAIKFTSKGTISVLASRLIDELTITIADTGVGMDQTLIDKLFKPYVQGPNSTHRHVGGTGLGLSLVRSYCELIGGSVELWSEPNKGTTFAVHIPLIISPPIVVEITNSELPSKEPIWSHP